MLIREFADQVIHWMTGGPLEKTVDTVKTGDPERELSGVACTFMATREVLACAVDLGANLVITHEPTFYNHLDETEWLAGDPVYQSKRAFLEEHNLVVWRVHDYLHRMRPDGIVAGVTETLGWKAEGVVVELAAPLPLAELALYIKKRLGISMLRIAGPPDMLCRRVGLRVGASGGRGQIELLRRDEIDVVLCGESAEWETCEWVRDAAAAGLRKGLLVLGHANSEEAGMRWLAEKLPALAPPGVRVTHLPAGDPFLFL